MIVLLATDALHLAQVMIEGEIDTFVERHVGRNVVVGKVDLAILHLARMDEQDVVDQLHFLEQNGADQAVEIAAGDQAELPSAFLQRAGQRFSSAHDRRFNGLRYWLGLGPGFWSGRRTAFNRLVRWL